MIKKLVPMLVAGLTAFALVACGGGEAATDAPAEPDTAEVTDATGDGAEATGTEGTDAAATNSDVVDIAGNALPADNHVDVSTIDYDVAAMSQEEAYAWTDSFGNRTSDEHEADFGRVVHIVGFCGRNNNIKDGEDHIAYSVGVKNPDTGNMFPIYFYVPGWTDEDYPEYKDTVEVTGVYQMVEGYGGNSGRCLVCNPEDVIVVESA